MFDAIAWFFDATDSIDWLEVIKALAPVATAVIALLALRNWQRQDKAKREAEFLDALIEAAHAYMAGMSKPITVFQFVKVGMESHAPTWEGGGQEATAVKGAIAFIEKLGEHAGKQLADALHEALPSTVRLRSLTAKGQVFTFEAYAKCQNAVATLTWHHGRLEDAAFVIRSPTLNWQNPEVEERLRTVMAIDPDAMRESLKQNSVVILEYARETYRRIYG